MQYKTIQGDTWDLIAFKLWGNENGLTRLISLNSQHAGTVIFPAGVILEVPDNAAEKIITIPPWRR